MKKMKGERKEQWEDKKERKKQWEGLEIMGRSETMGESKETKEQWIKRNERTMDQGNNGDQ